MMMKVVGLLAVLGLAVALPAREKRQAIGCLSAFQNVPNVCKNNPSSKVFFSHPTDPTKFLQCDVSNRMYIIQCPTNEVFNVANSACQVTSVPQVTPPPITLPPPSTTTITTTAKPVSTTVKQVTPQLPGVSLPNNNNNNNPCTPLSIALGQIYFPFPGDMTKFYECDQKGNAKQLSCPKLLVWDQNILSCVFPLNGNQQQTGTTVPQVKPTPRIPSGNPNNPCTKQAITAGHFFFPHPDPHKYIQCDLWGDAFTNSCPTQLVWNPYLETCYSPFVQGPVNGRK